MLIFTGYHHEDDSNIPVVITVEYDEDIELYIVEVSRGTDTDFKTFAPKKKPEDGAMFISDLEKAVKCANKLVKRLKEEALRRKVK